MEIVKFLFEIFKYFAPFVLFMIIKFNDLKHLEASVNEMNVKLDDIIERVSKIEGYLEAKK